MKKSTRWIVISVVAIAVIVLLVNILLYQRLRHGYVTTVDQEQAAQRAHFRLQDVHHLILSGTIWVNIVPGDSNAIQVPVEQVDPADKIPFLFRLDVPDALGKGRCFRQAGDTLYVQGTNMTPLHRPFADWFYRRGVPQINVFASSLRDIRVENGQIVIKGRPGQVTATSLRLVAQRSTVWLGEMDNRPESAMHGQRPDQEFFDTVSLRLSNSILLLNRPATIASLEARIDSSSELNDRSANLGQSHISATRDSRVSLTGGNLSKTIITTE